MHVWSYLLYKFCPHLLKVKIGKLKCRVRHQKWLSWRWDLFWCWTMDLWVFWYVIDKMLRTHNFFGLMFMTKRNKTRKLPITLTGLDQKIPNYQSPECEFQKDRNEHKEASRPENVLSTWQSCVSIHLIYSYGWWSPLILL